MVECWQGRKQKGLDGQQDQPWNSTPSPMGWYFIHARGLKTDTVLSPQAANSQERCSLTSPPVQPSEAGVQRLNPLAPSEQNQGSGAVLGSSPSHFCLFSAFVSAASVGVALVTTAVTVIFCITNIHSLGALSCPVHPLIHNRFPLLFFNVQPYISCVLNKI